MEIGTIGVAPAATRENDRRWQAVIDRDRSFDQAFVYAVVTTGVYCRPSCPSRRAKIDHVRFFDRPDDAVRAGFRACRRCKPDQASGDAGARARIVESCRMIDDSATIPPLAELAAAADLSPWQFHRLFKAVTGVTPKAYAAQRRAQRLHAELVRPDATVTTALYDAGFNSSGRFYEAVPTLLGMTPSSFRAGGAATTIRFAIGHCSLGAVLVACSARGVCAILIGDSPDDLLRDLQDRFGNAVLIGDDPDYDRLVATVIAGIEEPARGIALPLDVRGTAFQLRVWQALRAIPAGSTATYRAIADTLGTPGGARAVAGACAANPLAVAIPCHRVVRLDGAPSGYRWGLARKQELLSRERRRSA